MERCRFLVASCVGTFFYVLVAFFGGRDGMWAMNQLLEQKRDVSIHAAEIEKTYDELCLEKVALQKDMDVVAAYARKLGFVAEGEKLVKVSGLPSRETQIVDPGTILRHTEVRFIPEWFCKAVGLVIFSLVYLILLLVDITRGNIRLPRKKAHFSMVKGTPVYDFVQS